MRNLILLLVLVFPICKTNQHLNEEINKQILENEKAIIEIETKDNIDKEKIRKIIINNVKVLKNTNETLNEVQNENLELKKENVHLVRYKIIFLSILISIILFVLLKLFVIKRIV